MACNDQPPFSLRPWPTGDKRPKTIAEFVARVNTQPGGFRDLDEEQLRHDIQAQQRGEVEDDDMDRSSEDDEEDDETDDGKDKTAMAARDEFLKNIDSAHQSAMLALDFVSLLLSKEAPVQAGATLSPALRDLVGIGTLGASKLKESNVTEAQKHDDLAIATGWRVMGINNMVDSVLAAAERLEKEVDIEAKYWDDVLAVSDDGWTVCTLPQEPQTLGVRFGFAESAPDFRNSSIAPLLRNDDGSIKLGVGRVGGGCQRIRVTVQKDGKIIDQSPLPERTPEDAPLNARVREARNTIFHQELWYEMNREARMLQSFEIYYDGTAIVWRQERETEMVFTLEDLGERDDAHVNLAGGIRSASAAYTFLQFLLFQSHRQNYYKRTSLSPAMRQSEPNSTYHIMRSLIARYDFFQNVEAISSLLNSLVRTLRHAGISSASISTALTPPSPLTPDATQPRYTSTTELLWVQQLAFNMAALHTFVITPEARVLCQSRGLMRPSIGTFFYFKLMPPSGEPGQAQNPLETAYPAPEYCSGVDEAIYYFCQASVRVVAQTIAKRVAEKLPNNDVQWSDTVTGVAIRDGKGRYAHLDLNVEGTTMTLTLTPKTADGTVYPSHARAWGSDMKDAGLTIESAVLDFMAPA